MSCPNSAATVTCSWSWVMITADAAKYYYEFLTASLELTFRSNILSPLVLSSVNLTSGQTVGTVNEGDVTYGWTNTR
jgi:hypothetical protein